MMPTLPSIWLLTLGRQTTMLRKALLCITWLVLGLLCSQHAHAQSALDGFNPSANDLVSRIVVQPDGKVLIGGSFTTINGTLRNRIARINADGTLDTTFDPGTGANGTVDSLAVQPDGKVLLGGSFTDIGGIPRNGIARLNADGSLDTSFNPGTGASSYVYSVALQPDGKVLIGGSFTTINGSPRNHIARLNADGALDTTFNPGTGADRPVDSIALQPDGKVLLGGSFTTISGSPRNHIARLNADGSLDASFDPGTGANNWVNILALQPDGKVLLGGNFTDIGGIPRNHIARLHADGTLDASFNPGTGADNVVNSLALQPDGKVLLGGHFTDIGGIPRNRIARLNADGALDTSFNPSSGADNVVNSLALQPDGKVLLGGHFTHIGGSPRNHIARLNADGTLDASFNPGTGANNVVNSLALQPDGKVLLGGDFTTINGSPRTRIARLNADGTLDTSFDPGTGANNWVYSVAVQPDGKVLLAGQFTVISGAARSYIARLNADGTLDASFNPGTGADRPVDSITLQPDGKVLLGGQFTAINGAARSYIARLNADGTLDTSFDPGTGANNWVTSLALQPDGKVLLGGGFTDIGGSPRNHIARLNADGSLDTSFDPSSGANGMVNSLALQPDGKVLLGGSFTTINRSPRNHIARLNADGSLDTSFDPGTGANNWVNSLALQPDGKVLLGGYFMQVNGSPRNHIARLNADGSLDTSFDPGTGTNNVVNSLALQPDGKVLLAGNFTEVNGTARNRIARLSLPEAAIQSLTSENNHTRLQWLRSGTGPEASQVRFAWTSVANAGPADWNDLGAATRIAGGWESTGLALPVTASSPIWVRAHGTATGGLYSGSSYPVQSVRMLQLPRTQPTVTATSSASTSMLGATVTLTATLSNAVNPTGDVTFTSGTTSLCTGAVLGMSASCDTTTLAMGSHSITATYGGDGNNAIATSAALSHVVSSYHSPLPLPTPPGGTSPGYAQVTITGPAGCTISNAAFSASVPTGAPAGSSAPLGVFSFDATSTTPNACDGATLTVTLTYPAGRLAGLQPYKFGPATAGATDTWFPHGSISGDTVTYTVTDNGVGDSNLTLGAMTDPFAPLAFAAVAIPTLSEWGVLLLSLLALAMGALHLHRREHTTR